MAAITFRPALICSSSARTKFKLCALFWNQGQTLEIFGGLFRHSVRCDALTQWNGIRSISIWGVHLPFFAKYALAGLISLFFQLKFWLKNPWAWLSTKTKTLYAKLARWSMTEHSVVFSLFHNCILSIPFYKCRVWNVSHHLWYEIKGIGSIHIN